MESEWLVVVDHNVVFIYLTIRLRAQDFYEVIVDEFLLLALQQLNNLDNFQKLPIVL